MFERLIKLVREEQVTLFIGAGFSIEANAPSVDMLRDAILSQFEDDQQREEHKNDSLAELSDFFVEEVCCGSRNSLIELLQKQFSFTPVKLDDHKALARIPHFHNIFTTNYDTLLEDSYSKDLCQVIRKDADCAYLDKNKPVKVFKIHGDFTNQDYVVITSSDYDGFFKHNYNKVMWDVVKNDFLTKHILFLGYSLSDNNIIKIIQNISKSINRNQKDMFLIAPNIGRGNQERLKKMKVTYYDAYASDFLAELKRNLNANIGKDFRHHKVSSETFSRYCELHNISPDIKLRDGKDNEIVDFHSVNGQMLEQEIKIMTNAKYKGIIESMNFEENGVIVSNSPFPTVPMIKFTGSDLLNCAHFVNGIVMNDEFESVLIGPAISNVTMTIRIPSRNFLENVMAKAYNVRRGKRVYEIDCHIFIMKMEIEVKTKDSLGLSLGIQVNITFKKRYSNNSEAIRWIDLASAFFSDEDIFIHEKTDMVLNAKNGTAGTSLNHHFDKFKKYYENVRRIELLTGKCFSEYNCYTEESYKASCLLLAYFKHKPVKIECPEGLDFATKGRFGSDFLEQIKDGKRISVVSTDGEKKKIQLNNLEFVIPYAHTILNSCEVRNVDKLEDGSMKVDFHYDSKEYAILYSYNPVKKEFPGLQMLEDCNEINEAV